MTDTVATPQAPRTPNTKDRALIAQIAGEIVANFQKHGMQISDQGVVAAAVEKAIAIVRQVDVVLGGAA